jgi:hypothetical protein
VPPALVQDTVNVVVKGSFNPGIFSPAWLRSNGVIGEGEHDNSVIELITQDIAKFRCVWLDVMVTRDTIQLGTDRVEEFERLRDAVVATLELLPHMPLAAMGINRIAHFDVGGVDGWHRVGDKLVPKQPWETALLLPGMKSVTLWGVRPDLHSGRIQVTVEPSSLLQLGIFVAHNDHFDLFDVESQPQERDEFFLQENTPLEARVDKGLSALSILRDEWLSPLSEHIES